MIISSTLRATPVRSLASETMTSGYTLLDLYQCVATLIERFQVLVDEISEVMMASGIDDNDRGLYGSAYQISQLRLIKANRKLTSIALEKCEK